MTFDMSLEFAGVPVMLRPMLAALADAQAESILRAFVERFGAHRQAA